MNKEYWQGYNDGDLCQFYVQEFNHNCKEMKLFEMAFERKGEVHIWLIDKRQNRATIWEQTFKLPAEGKKLIATLDCLYCRWYQYTKGIDISKLKKGGDN